jgi:uncharacterized protein YcbK (DUF882 family)
LSDRHTTIARPARRAFLTGLAATASIALVPRLAAATTPERRLALVEMRTHEDVDVAYWRDGDYRAGACQALDRLLRDHYNHEVRQIDRSLYDLLYDLRAEIGVEEAYAVTCGYRSPQTNAWLSKKRRGVAKNSLHMYGKAVDVYLPGVKLRTLRDAARELKRGGVGYYPRPGFVHLDVGDVRYWAG